jgi:FtsZ-binding cell division protein ZapB
VLLELQDFRRELLAAVDRAEGRMSRELIEVEKRLGTRRESREMAEISAQLTISEKQRKEDAEAWQRLRRLLLRAVFGLAGLAGISVTAFLDRSCTSHELATEAKAVAAQAVDAKAAEIVDDHAQTRAQTEANSKRIDALEGKLDQVLELLQRPVPPEPEPVVPPRKGHK